MDRFKIQLVLERFSLRVCGSCDCKGWENARGCVLFQSPRMREL